MTSSATSRGSLLDEQRVAGRPVVAAIGGGHGLAATLHALTDLSVYPVAVVGTADDGNSSGRLRQLFPCLPPGDMRMACGALVEASASGAAWAQLLHTRFAQGTPLAGHAIGNLLLLSLLLDDEPVHAMVRASQVLGIDGLVVPAANTALELVAEAEHADGTSAIVRGQVSIATTPATMRSVWFEPTAADVAPEVADLVSRADAIIMGPGSWWTSVIPPLLLPGLHEAIVAASGLRIVVLNLGAQTGETSGYTAANHLHVLHDVLPDLRIDVVIADPRTVDDATGLEGAAADLGAVVEYGEVGQTGAAGSVLLAHDSAALATVLRRVLDKHGRINACR